jgi:hypothetical protein
MIQTLFPTFREKGDYGNKLDIFSDYTQRIHNVFVFGCFPTTDATGGDVIQQEGAGGAMIWTSIP